MNAMLIERECGGWLAITPDGSRLNIAVTAASADEARDQLDAALVAWDALLERAAHREVK
jgi:hypothetical protein